jgi:hypothetical protein
MLPLLLLLLLLLLPRQSATAGQPARRCRYAGWLRAAAETPLLLLHWLLLLLRAPLQQAPSHGLRGALHWPAACQHWVGTAARAA